MEASLILAIEDLVCDGQSFKLLWLPDYGVVLEDEWENSLQNFLDQNGYEGASLVEFSYAIWRGQLLVLVRPCLRQ